MDRPPAANPAATLPDPPAAAPLSAAERESRDAFLRFARVFRQDLDARFTRADHRRSVQRTFLMSMGAYALAAGGLLAGLSAGIPHGLLYLWTFLVCFVAHRMGMTVVHGRVHNPFTTGSRRVDQLIDLVASVATLWSSEAFKPRHWIGHGEEVGLYSGMRAPGRNENEAVPLGYFANPLLGWRALLDRRFREMSGINSRMLAVQVLAITAWFGVAVAEVALHGTAFILVGHLLSGILGLSAAILVSSLVHSSLARPNSFESCAIMHADDAGELLGVSLFLLDTLMVKGMGTGHVLHHAHPTVATGILRHELPRWRAYVRAHHPEARYNRTLVHDIYRRTFASLGEPTWLDRVLQGVATLVALLMGALLLVGLLPGHVFALTEHLMVDYRLALRLATLDRRALADLRDWMERSGFAAGAAAAASHGGRRLQRPYEWLSARLA